MLRRDPRLSLPLILLAGGALLASGCGTDAGPTAEDTLENQGAPPADAVGEGTDGDDAIGEGTDGAAADSGATPDEEDCPIPYLERRDDLIEEGETHFAALYKITAGGENAEAYWSYAGDRLVLQRKEKRDEEHCDRIYVTDSATGELQLVSDGRGVTTCAYFLPGDRSVVYASTGLEHTICPGMPIVPEGIGRGYMWALHPEYDIFARDLETGERIRLTETEGYDAEATVSPAGDRMVFTSTRSGDIELWTSDLDGSNLVQVTDVLGYDGGAFFSHGADRLVFRSTEFSDDEAERESEVADYRRLLDAHLVKPSRMEIYVCATDGSERQKITDLGGANFSPYFTPDDSQILFSSNWEHPGARAPLFDLYLVPSTGGPYGAEDVERVTTYEGFDSFPMFSPDGKWLAFASNRGNEAEGVTNVFVARWKD